MPSRSETVCRVSGIFCYIGGEVGGPEADSPYDTMRAHGVLDRHSASGSQSAPTLVSVHGCCLPEASCPESVVGAPPPQGWQVGPCCRDFERCIPRFAACAHDGRLEIGTLQRRIRQYTEESCLQDLVACRNPRPLICTKRQNGRICEGRWPLTNWSGGDWYSTCCITTTARWWTTRTRLASFYEPSGLRFFREALALSLLRLFFGAHVVEVPPGTTFTWPRGRIAEIATELPDSSPGPDGLRYTLWAHLPPISWMTTQVTSCRGSRLLARCSELTHIPHAQG